MELTELKRWFKYKDVYSDDIYIIENLNLYINKKEKEVATSDYFEIYYFKDSVNNIFATTSCENKYSFIGILLEESDELKLNHSIPS